MYEILLVEDRPLDVALTKRAIEKTELDCTLTVASHGREALEKLAKLKEAHRHIDLVLLDWMMPIMNGEEFLARFREEAEYSNVPVIILTTSSDSRDVHLAHSLGCNAYMIKPVGVSKFQSAVNSFKEFWFDVAVLPKIA